MIEWTAQGRWQRRSYTAPEQSLRFVYGWTDDVVSTTLALDDREPRTGTLTLRRGAREWILEERWPDLPLFTWTWTLDAEGNATAMAHEAAGQTLARWSCTRDSEGRIVHTEVQNDEGLERWDFMRDAEGRVTEMRDLDSGSVTALTRAAGVVTATMRGRHGDLSLVTRYEGDCEDLLRPRCGWDVSSEIPSGLIPP